MSVLISVKGFFAAIFACLISLSSIITPLISQVKDSDQYFENWSAQQQFTREYCTELKKQPNKDFVVLNLTDVQLNVFESYGNAGKLAKDTIDKLVNEKKPDLITLTGDNAWSVDAYLWIVKTIDSYGIPWAPVMGNHDGQGCPSEWWCAWQFVNAKNCLFKFGPKDMGYGNYIINITENGKIIHTLFMMDTHSGCTDTEYGKINGTDGGYDNLWASQIEWYKWAVNGIKTIEGKTVESTLLMHIPLREYFDAMYEQYNIETKLNDKGETVLSETSSIKDEYKDSAFGANHEFPCPAPKNNGMFAVIKELGSTKNVIVGHDHVNSLSLVYQGIRLSYGVKTGKGCYWEKEMNGGSLLTVNSNGVGTFSHAYIEVK